MIRLVGLTHTFDGRKGAVPALESINLDVAKGEFVAVVGRSGCGKSTLLRVVAGLLSPTSGEVSVGDQPVDGPRANVTLVFQRPALLPWRSVLDNVMLPAEIHRWPRREYRARAYELLELVGLAGFERRLPHELSGGMQQRVAVCRALLTSPEVLLMDEPFSALDALTREELSTGLQDIHMQLGTTILFVTHSIDEAVLLADRVVVLTERPGRVRTVIDVDLPRPRSLGLTEHSAEMARCTAQLHDLLRPAHLRSPATTSGRTGQYRRIAVPVQPAPATEQVAHANGHLAATTGQMAGANGHMADSPEQTAAGNGQVATGADGHAELTGDDQIVIGKARHRASG